MVVVTKPATTKQGEETQIVTIPIGGLSIGSQTLQLFTPDGEDLALIETRTVRALSIHWDPIGEQLGLRISQRRRMKVRHRVA